MKVWIFLDQELNSYSHISPHFVVVVVFVGGDLFETSLTLRRLKSDRGEIWRECFSSKFRLTESDFPFGVTL